MVTLGLPLAVSVDGEIIERDVFPDVSVYVQSPNYPDSFDPNTEVHWILTADEGERIIFVFKYFKMDSRGDKLLVSYI